MSLTTGKHTERKQTQRQVKVLIYSNTELDSKYNLRSKHFKGLIWNLVSIRLTGYQGGSILSIDTGQYF